MKKFNFTLLIGLIGVINIFAQAPQSFKYQTVVRDNSGDLITNQTVSFRIGIIQDSINGVLVYSETHNETTNNFGMVSLKIGIGTVESGVFNEINWGASFHFLKVELDETGNTNYQFIGTSELLSVPYALNSSSLTMVDTNGLVWHYYVNPFGQLVSTPVDPGDIGCGTSIVDPRDSQTYPIVQIGLQCWMSKNMNIGNMINEGNAQTNNGVIEKFCYDNNPTNCDTYGGLYQWDEVVQYSSLLPVQGICPDGWHIPSNYEFAVLIAYLGENAGGKMKEMGTLHWQTPNTNATNESGFTALPGGQQPEYGGFNFLGSNGIFWSSTEHGTNSLSAAAIGLSYDSGGAIQYNSVSKAFGLSVRCLKD